MKRLFFPANPVILFLFILFVPNHLAASAQSLEPGGVYSETAAGHTFSFEPLSLRFSRPWGAALLPDGSMLVTERPGELYLVRSAEGGSYSKTPLGPLPELAARGQGGLLDVHVDVDFSENNYMYLSYSDTSGGRYATALYRARLDYSPGNGNTDSSNTDTAASLREGSTIFSMDTDSSSTRHFGSRIAQRPDGLLFLTIGDRGERDLAQNPQRYHGSVVALQRDGSLQPAAASGWKAGMYSIGHRNAQGMLYDPSRDLLWLHEHGPRGGDELNLVQAGTNYGWPTISYGDEYTGGDIGIGTEAEGLAQPHWYWTPSIAPSGMALIDAATASPGFAALDGSLLVGGLALQRIVLLQMEYPAAGEARVQSEHLLVNGVLGRIREIQQAADGSFWVFIDADNAPVYRMSLKPAN